ncbi:peptidoglycan-binding domain-containing protein [Dactylosporangium sp. CA-139114]|uniref:peptidoglycan-binding domain-containing protein n=1 Tax=Dactylosporangium sp. CA-139114 TaxID=3239931 RepID=UPI003D961F1F
MNKALRIALATATAAAMSGITLVGTGGAAWAAGTCSTTYTFRTDYGSQTVTVYVPSTGSTAASTTCDMGQGAQSAAVKTLQRTLNNCYYESLSVDGIFGANTKAALKRAQASEELRGNDVDGVYGPITRDSIMHYTSLGGHACKYWNGPGGL